MRNLTYSLPIFYFLFLLVLVVILNTNPLFLNLLYYILILYCVSLCPFLNSLLVGSENWKLVKSIYNIMSTYILLCNYRGGAGLWGHFTCAVQQMVQGFCFLPFTQNHIVFVIFVSELTCMSFSFFLGFLITLFPCG